LLRRALDSSGSGWCRGQVWKKDVAPNTVTKITDVVVSDVCWTLKDVEGQVPGFRLLELAAFLLRHAIMLCHAEWILIHTFVNTYIHTYIHTHIQHTYIHICIFTCIHTYIDMHACILTFIYIHIITYLYK
jgi:hypothetical protein